MPVDLCFSVSCFLFPGPAFFSHYSTAACNVRITPITTAVLPSLKTWQAFGYGVLPGGDVDEVEIPSNIDVNTLV